MKLKELKLKFEHLLSVNYPSEEIQSFFTLLTEFFLKYNRLDTVLRAEEDLAEEQVQQFESALARLQQHEPIQYIIGSCEFYGLPFAVNEHTLIPRPETEELVAWILESEGGTTSTFPRSLLDIGTGSGCIAIALSKHLTNTQISALDFSAEALQMARSNALKNEVSVDFFQQDILNAISLPAIYDVIVSNPPYVRELEKKMMQTNVLAYEPNSALFVSDEDPLLFYRAIAQLATRYLSKNGTLFFEINEYLSEEMEKMLDEEGFVSIEIRRDLFGKDRMIKCIKHEITT